MLTMIVVKITCEVNEREQPLHQNLGVYDCTKSSGRVCGGATPHDRGISCGVTGRGVTLGRGKYRHVSEKWGGENTKTCMGSTGALKENKQS